ncbi:MAG: dTDP-4-dehydrorhamnose 3,5-epimerase [Kiritimatiellae bacterium]|nr:dTDP-4-dehydrorhamnose 3,5-epimerase [Kiritimatiellia bacterium]MBR4945468.1 dTDP-4-dehydrorhamnose 3,5-epimerase [Kiritimatiellia bacterium]MBR5588031.1 dTDP-4-dehydrorhamnose 3,5-epimerase [Kiritimatiellia bacterium]
MEVHPTALPDVKLICPNIFRDDRGYFCEIYNTEAYRAAGITANFVQDNESLSMRGVIRGLHWQEGLYAQAKLVRVIRGAVWDVAVDIRKDSPTFGQSVATLLTADNGHQFFIPRGFAHGFAVLEDNTLFAYKCDNFYYPQAERGLRYDDPQLNIAWPDMKTPPILSRKDQLNPLLSEITPWSCP